MLISRFKLFCLPFLMAFTVPAQSQDLPDDLRFEEPVRYRLPTEFEIRDALETIKFQGHR